MSKIQRAGIAAVAGVLLLASSACGGGGDDTTKSNDKPAASEKKEPAKEAAPETAPGEEAAGGMVGPGCAGYAKQVPNGKGSVEGMAKDPVAVAASNNPLLKTLVQAVSGKLNPKVDLVDTLNGGEFTVFAPVDDAFAKIPAKTIDGLKTDDKTLTSILTYHVVPGQLAPDAVVGDHKTVEGKAVKVTGSGDQLKVNDASVICGGVKTKNATVYLVDSVLMPPAS